MLKKNLIRIIILGALAVTILMNFQSLIIVMVNQEKFGATLGLNFEALMMRILVYFTYAFTLLSFNIIWKYKWRAFSKWAKARNVIVNFGIFMLAVITNTSLMAAFLTGSLERRQVFMLTFTSFLIVLPILLLLARFITLNLRQQQIEMEKEQAKQKALQHQLEALRSQINPHFLFNALNSLTVLIRTKSDRALRFVDQLSWLLRATLLRSEEDFITIQNELEYLESYVFLQKERFAEKFKVDIRIPEHWKKELIPSFSLQLLVENAIKHNVVSKNNPLLLEIYPEDEYLIIRNRIQMRRDSTEGQGIGLLNLSVRFKHLKKRDIQINRDENHFTVKLPVLNQ